MSSLGLVSIAGSQLANNADYARMNLERSVSKISSGTRLGDAGEDAAGFSISSRLQNAQIGVKKAMENTNQGISMLSTVEGSLSEIQNIIVRMRELAVQSSTETYTDSDRSMLNSEYTQLFKEIDRITTTASFNDTIKLLTSTNTSFDLQVGYLSNSDHRISLDLTQFNSSTTDLGLNVSPDLSTQTNAMSAINTLDAAFNIVSKQRTVVGSYLNRLESTLEESTSFHENTTSAVSRIVDVDYAVESASMTSNQILRQASVAALAQAKNVNVSHFQSIFANM